MTAPHFIGIDIAGEANTWFCSLTPGKDGVLHIGAEPAMVNLEQVVAYCREHLVLGVAIDAHLTLRGKATRP